ncbi:hypothetical protein [Actinoplanes regularis]|uniref:hypothetical protein n=1 Tax=Actinoplanes regularis TaxID=52697 RepID=UPI0025554608|nr:hypothetical protein [Actinoplanes regularis]
MFRPIPVRPAVRRWVAALVAVLVVGAGFAGMSFSAGADVLAARFVAAAFVVMVGFAGLCWALAEIITAGCGQHVTRTEFGSGPRRQPCGC